MAYFALAVANKGNDSQFFFFLFLQLFHLMKNHQYDILEKSGEIILGIYMCIYIYIYIYIYLLYRLFHTL